MSKSTNLEIENGKIYTGYDAFAAAEVCTPSILGCKACLSAGVVDGYVALTISVKTPFGNYSKTWKIVNNVSFTWEPISNKFKISIDITNFAEAGGTFSFDASVKACVNIISWRCVNLNHHFSIPTLLADLAPLSDEDFAAKLALATTSGEICKDCNDNNPSKFLQGDLYNQYLQATPHTIFPTQAPLCYQQSAAFPTIPVVSCVTCTGISPICLAAAPQSLSHAAGFPTIPVVSCVTCTGIPVVCAAAAAAPLAAPQAAGFPTIPVVSCVTCTGIPVVCAAAAPQAAPQLAAGFPTIPVVSCVTCTGIPVVCAAAAAAPQAVPQAAGFPTIPVVSCVTCTGIPVVCAAAAAAPQAVPQAAGFPTIPVVSCVTCTGIPVVCAAAAAAPQAAPQAAGFPTIPVVSCVTCTGIPVVCATAQ